MIVLTLEQLLELHVMVIAQSGGSDGLRDLGRLESALASQTQSVFGEELYSTLAEKAAALIRSIIGDHPFVDGNKRAAMLTGLTFLSVNDVKFRATAGELEDFAVKVATDHLDILSIAAWLEAHTKEKS